MSNKRGQVFYCNIDVRSAKSNPDVFDVAKKDLTPFPRSISWKIHGQFMKALVHAAKEFVDLGLVTEEEKADIVSQAAGSECGK